MNWNIDPSHSSIEFAVRHMGLSTVRGRFTSFDADIDADAEGMPRSLDVRIDVASIDTGEKDRDAHLKSGDFFDVENHPKIRFESTGIREQGDRVKVEGDLTIRGTTRPVTFDVDLAPARPDPFGNYRAAAVAETKINRKDWGLTWNQVLEAGALLVGEDVRVSIDLQAIAPMESAGQGAGRGEQQGAATD